MAVFAAAHVKYVYVVLGIQDAFLIRTCWVQIMLLQNSLLMGGRVDSHDHFRDWRLDVDNMSYEVYVFPCEMNRQFSFCNAFCFVCITKYPSHSKNFLILVVYVGTA